MRTEKMITGELGERIAERFLLKQNYKTLSRNYRVGYGELDLIMAFGGVTHFVEVKTVTRETLGNADSSYRPEENMHPQKIKVLLRTIERYLMEHGDESDWQLDLVAVELHVKQKKAVVRHIECVN